MTKAKYFFHLICILFICHNGFTQNPKTQVKLDSLHFLLKQTNDLKKRSDALFRLGYHYKSDAYYNKDSIFYYANKALELSKTQKNYKNQVKAHDLLWYVCFEEKYKKETYGHLKKIFEISKQNNYGDGLVLGHLRSSEINYILTNFKLALEDNKKAYETAKTYTVSNKTFFNVTVDYAFNCFQDEKSVPLISKLLLEAEPFKDAPYISYKNKAYYYRTLGDLYTYHNDYENAIVNHKKSSDLYLKANDSQRAYSILYKVAKNHYLLGDTKKAITTYTKALPFAKSKTVIFYDLGSIYLELKAYKKAEQHLQQALIEFENHRKYRKTARSYFNVYYFYSDFDSGNIYFKIGKTYQLQNNVKKAQHFFNIAIEKYEKYIHMATDGENYSNLKNKNNHLNQNKYAIHRTTHLAELYQRLSEIYTFKNNFKKSLSYHKLYSIYNDSVVTNQNLKKSEQFNFYKKNVESNSKIEDLKSEQQIRELERENEKNYKKALLLFLAIGIILLVILFNRYRVKQKAVVLIEEKNEENIALMQEIHHRVKNNLQIISSLLGAKIDSNAADENIKNILKESQNKIKSMAIIHQNLYQGNRYAKVSVKGYIDDFIAHIKSSFLDNNQSIIFDLDIETKEIKMGLAVPLGLILNELITNAYKYAFTDTQEKEKKISIGFHQLENTSKYSLIVKDNGKGLPDDFDMDKLSSFGLQLVYGLTEQLHGDVTITQDKDTTFKIVLEEPG